MTVALLFDASAIAALGHGHRDLSKLIVQSRAGADTRLYMPVLCLADAEAARPGTVAHIGGLDGVTFVDFDFTHAQPVADLVRTGVSWQGAHAVVAGRGDPEWPDGRPILTAAPEAYKGLPARVIAVS